MSFLLPCPNCGPRDVNEFAYAGEVTERPRESPSLRELASYVAERDTRTNEVLKTELPPQGITHTAPAEAAVGPDAPAV
jgi:sarcosine oxidase delta subunit